MKEIKFVERNGDRFASVVARMSEARGGVKLNTIPTFLVTCRDKHGNIKWEDDIKNIVTLAGRNNLLDVMFHGGSQTGTWYVGLLSTGPTVGASNTLATGTRLWEEITAYDEATRQAFVEGAASGGSMDNVGNLAVFTIDTNSTGVGGAFIASTGTKDGETGTLYCCGAFTAGDKSLDDDDTISVTVTLTAIDDA